jgi:hypothetical protein
MSWNQPKFCHCGKPGEVLFVIDQNAECGFCKLINEHIAKFKEEEKKRYHEEESVFFSKEKMYEYLNSPSNKTEWTIDEAVDKIIAELIIHRKPENSRCIFRIHTSMLRGYSKEEVQNELHSRDHILLQCEEDEGNDILVRIVEVPDETWNKSKSVCRCCGK